MKSVAVNNYEISNHIISGTFNYMKRIDDVFGTGSFQFESQTITDNIPPYSILNVDNNIFLCSSEATYHYGKKSWIHNVSIIESTAILSRFLVGSKVFSITGTNTYDYEKANILIDLVNKKYDVLISFNQNINLILYKQIEYVFSAGTTLYDALNEIAKQYNCRVKVSSILSSGKVIKIDFVELYDLPTLDLDNYQTLSITKIQNAETYCKYLESEAKNVVDLGEKTKVNNLYPSANEIKLSEDTYLLKLPTPVYEVTSFKANLSGNYCNMEVSLTINPNKIKDVEKGTKTYEQWCSIIPSMKSLFNDVFSQYFTWEYFKEQNWTHSSNNIIKPENADIIRNAVIKIDLSEHIISKEKYELLEDKDKPNYAYYTLGSNVIDGFNIFYKNDFWNTIIGNNVNPFMKNVTYANSDYNGVVYDDYITINKYLVQGQYNFSSTTYDVEYYAISNLYLTNEKVDTPSNESKYKPYSLSYGKTNDYIDFDKITTSMDIENQSMGKEEAVIELLYTGDDVFGELGKFTFEDKEMITISSEIIITPQYKKVRYNLVSNYNKIADVISLNSQYNSVKNPLQNIIERPLYYELEQRTITKGTTYVVIQTYDKYNVKLNTICLAPSIFSKDEEVYLYCEMLDQYSAGTNAIEVSSGVYKVNDVKYVNRDNEVYSVSIYLKDIHNLTLEEARLMPQNKDISLSGAFNIVKKQTIYKDAREKLTFTIKIKNCIIK